MSKESVEADYRYILADTPGFRYEYRITPRIVYITPEHEVLLYRYNDTRWWGLPGGKVSKHEVIKTRKKLYSMGQVEDERELLRWGPTLRREILEEAGVRLSPQALQSGVELIAHTTVTTIDTDPRLQDTLVAKQAYTPLYYGWLNQKGCTFDERNALIPINGPMPGPLFPDASDVLGYIRTQLKQGWDPYPNAKRNLNINLGPPGGYFFQMKPEMGLLMIPPPWLTKMKGQSGTVY